MSSSISQSACLPEDILFSDKSQTQKAMIHSKN